jgi:hypothetical protein
MKCTILTAALWASLFFDGKAAAADYIVNYALDMDGKTDVGKKETCEYVRPCEIVSESAGVRVIMNFSYPDHLSVTTHVYGRLGCCYFRDGVDSISLDPKLPLHHLQTGHPERRPQRRAGLRELSQQPRSHQRADRRKPGSRSGEGGANSRGIARSIAETPNASTVRCWEPRSCPVETLRIISLNRKFRLLQSGRREKKFSSVVSAPSG